MFNSQANDTPQVTTSVSVGFATSSQGIQHGHTNPFGSTQANTTPQFTYFTMPNSGFNTAQSQASSTMPVHHHFTIC